MTMEQYIILGVNPVPWKSPSVAVIRVKGRAIPKVYKPAEVVAFQAAIKEQMEGMSPPARLIEHERIALHFYLWRNAGTKSDHVADATNMQKALEDALQGILFKNDRNVAVVTTWVMEQGPDVDPRIVIEIGEAPANPSVIMQSDTHMAAIKHHEERPDFNVEEIF